MKVGMYYNNRDVRVEELPRPEVGPGDVLIRVRASGICGSDIMEWYRIKRAPLVLGHELTGEVVEVGPGVDNFNVGDRVFAIHHVPCDECPECMKGHQTACTVFQRVNNFSPGGFSEYLKVSGASVRTGMLRLPDNMSYEEGTFIEPLGTVLRGLRTVGIRPGDTFLIMGSGLSGLLYIKAAKALGAGKIIAVDIAENRLAAAKKMGATATINASGNVQEVLNNLNDGRLADKVILCTGSLPAVRQALESVEKGGVVLFFAVPKPGETFPVDFNPFWRNDIAFKTSYGSAPIDHLEALQLLENGRIDVSDMITHRFPLDDIQSAFSLAAEGKECLKVIIEMKVSHA